MISFFPSRTVVFALGPLSVYWYGLLYVVGYIVALVLAPRLQLWRKLTLTRGEWIEVVAWAALGVIAGGRLGYAVFYDWPYFTNNPGALWRLSEGGMSAHGGFIGAAALLWWASHTLKVNFWKLVDIAVIPAALGLALGRLGNFINQELFASPFIFLVIGKDIALAVVCYLYLRHTEVSGRVGALFLILYAGMRCILEFWRLEPHMAFGPLSLEQWLTIPLGLAGIILWWNRGQTRRL